MQILTWVLRLGVALLSVCCVAASERTSCSPVPVECEVDCDDGDPCTIDDQCQAGLCVGAPLECNDDLECTTDSCAEGVCRFEVIPDCCGNEITESGEDCDDGFFNGWVNRYEPNCQIEYLLPHIGSVEEVSLVAVADPPDKAVAAWLSERDDRVHYGRWSWPPTASFLPTQLTLGVGSIVESVDLASFERDGLSILLIQWRDTSGQFVRGSILEQYDILSSWTLAQPAPTGWQILTTRAGGRSLDAGDPPSIEAVILMLADDGVRNRLYVARQRASIEAGEIVPVVGPWAFAGERELDAAAGTLVLHGFEMWPEGHAAIVATFRDGASESTNVVLLDLASDDPQQWRETVVALPDAGWQTIAVGADLLGSALVLLVAESDPLSQQWRLTSHVLDGATGMALRDPLGVPSTETHLGNVVVAGLPGMAVPTALVGWAGETASGPRVAGCRLSIADGGCGPVEFGAGAGRFILLPYAADGRAMSLQWHEGQIWAEIVGLP